MRATISALGRGGLEILGFMKPGGLGVHFMKKVMDEVKYEKNEWGGTSLTMVKRLQQGESQ